MHVILWYPPPVGIQEGITIAIDCSLFGVLKPLPAVSSAALMTTASIPQCKPMSGGCWCRLPGRAGGYPASPPTDPYVRNERIRFFGHQSFGTTLAHHCAALHARSDVVDDLGYGQGIPSQKLLEFLPPDTARAAAPTQPVSPRFLRVTGHALQHAEVSSKPVVRKMPTSLQAEYLVLVFHGSVTVGATPSPQGLLGAT